jgi:hypothetical protein
MTTNERQSMSYHVLNPFVGTNQSFHSYEEVDPDHLRFNNDSMNPSDMSQLDNSAYFHQNQTIHNFFNIPVETR